MKRLYGILLAAVLLLSVSVPVFAAPISDAPATDHWVYEYYEKVYDAGLIQGYPDGTFKGNKAATRYEVVAFMARLLNYFEERLGEAGPDTDTGVTTGTVLSEDDVKALIEEALAGVNYVDAATLTEETDLLWTAINELEKALRDDLNAMGVRVTTLEKKVDALEKSVATLDKSVADLNGEVRDLKAADKDVNKANNTALVVGIGAAILGIVGIVLGLIP